MVAVKVQPIIAVNDVLATSTWYSEILGVKPLSRTYEETHGNVYNRLLDGNELILQLHSWDDEEQPNLVNKSLGPSGHGVLLWFEVADFDGAVKRAQSLGVEIVADVHVNHGPKHREFWIRDLDGYVVVLVSPDGECG